MVGVVCYISGPYWICTQHSASNFLAQRREIHGKWENNPRCCMYYMYCTYLPGEDLDLSETEFRLHQGHTSLIMSIIVGGRKRRERSRRRNRGSTEACECTTDWYKYVLAHMICTYIRHMRPQLLCKMQPTDVLEG